MSVHIGSAVPNCAASTLCHLSFYSLNSHIPDAKISAVHFSGVCIVAEWYILKQKCLKKWIGSPLLGTQRYNFQPPTPTLSATKPFVTDRQKDRQKIVITTANHTACQYNWLKKFCIEPGLLHERSSPMRCSEPVSVKPSAAITWPMLVSYRQVLIRKVKSATSADFYLLSQMHFPHPGANLCPRLVTRITYVTWHVLVLMWIQPNSQSATSTGSTVCQQS